MMHDSKDAIDEWRKRVEELNQSNAPGQVQDKQQGIPTQLTHDFDIRFKPKADADPWPMRKLTGKDMGKFVSIECLVVKVNSVMPRVQVNTYACDQCHREIFQPVEGEYYKPVTECPTPHCKQNSSGGGLVHNVRTSKFTRFQEVKIQECSKHVPQGCVPRNMTVMLTGDLT